MGPVDEWFVVIRYSSNPLKSILKAHYSKKFEVNHTETKSFKLQIRTRHYV